jgi:hypothetical protein
MSTDSASTLDQTRATIDRLADHHLTCCLEACREVLAKRGRYGRRMRSMMTAAAEAEARALAHALEHDAWRAASQNADDLIEGFGIGDPEFAKGQPGYVRLCRRLLATELRALCQTELQPVLRLVPQRAGA